MVEALRFLVREGERDDTLVLRKERVTIGRSTGNDICISDLQASRVHCAIEQVDGVVRITDLGSQNGTYVNGSRILSVDLARGDTIRVGSAEVVYGDELGAADTAVIAPRRARPTEEVVRELSQERAFLMRLTSVVRDVAMERELMPLLNRILDAVLELTGAERAFVVLIDKSGELECEASRNFEGSEVRNPDVAVSRSIAQQVLETGEPVFSVNAREDDRFRAVQSIVNLVAAFGALRAAAVPRRPPRRGLHRQPAGGVGLLGARPRPPGDVRRPGGGGRGQRAPDPTS